MIWLEMEKSNLELMLKEPVCQNANSFTDESEMSWTPSTGSRELSIGGEEGTRQPAGGQSGD